MKSIVVFCGSNTGINPVYKNVAVQLGAYLAQNNYRLVYGGGNIGLMGIIADTVLVNGGEAVGVIPYFLQQREVGHESLTELILVNTMHQRKQQMCDLADAFITIPGGIGSMDELFEILTWKQLHLHHKPIGILNCNGYYNHLIALLNQMHSEKFVSDQTMQLFVVSDTIEGLFSKMEI